MFAVTNINYVGSKEWNASIRQELNTESLAWTAIVQTSGQLAAFAFDPLYIPYTKQIRYGKQVVFSAKANKNSEVCVLYIV